MLPVPDRCAADVVVTLEWIAESELALYMYKNHINATISYQQNNERKEPIIHENYVWPANLASNGSRHTGQRQTYIGMLNKVWIKFEFYKRSSNLEKTNLTSLDIYTTDMVNDNWKFDYWIFLSWTQQLIVVSNNAGEAGKHYCLSGECSWSTRLRNK